MKSQSIRVALLSVLVLASPLFTFAASQPKVRPIDKSDLQKTSALPQAVQFGKGSGKARNQAASSQNAPVGADRSAALSLSSDSAYRK
jgi:hypothetical protein